MKNLLVAFALIIGVSMTGCAGVEKNISADDCGCPKGDQKTTLIKNQQGISADDCGCPDNDRKTKLSKDKDPNMTAD